MKAVVLDVDEALLEERRSRGADRWDEMWEGLLHMVPPPAGEHQRLGTRLMAALLPAADAAGLLLSYETGLYRAADDYRVPDLMAYRPEAASHRGVDGPPELVVEIRSPGDETDDKLRWYLALGARQVLVVGRDDLALALHDAEGRVGPDEGGWLALASLGARIRAGGAGLEVEGPGGPVRISPPL